MRRATTARPDDAPLRFNYGATLAGLGRDGEALAQFEEAVRLGLPGPRVVAARAKVLVRLAREAEARDVLADGARRFPADREISELLGLLREPLSRSAFRVAGSA
jgi:Flp pilus assembly protein TadD